jgi:hypothetical protein
VTGNRNQQNNCRADVAAESLPVPFDYFGEKTKAFFPPSSHRDASGAPP